MPLDNNFFTPEEIDKQIEDLSRIFQSKRPEVHDQQNMRLMQHIRRFYRTSPEEDTNALNSAWERIAHERRHAKIRVNEEGQVNEMRFSPTNNVSIAKKTMVWRQLGILAAVLLIGLVVGSMLMVFNQVRQSGSGSSVNGSPAIPAKHKAAQDSQLNLYVSDYGSIYKIDSKTGKKDWTFNPHSTSTQSPLVVDGVVYFSSGDAESYTYALNANNGTLRWKVKYQSVSAVAHGIVYATHVDADNIHIDLDALDASTGKVLWHYNPGLQAAMVTVSNGVLYGTGSVNMSFEGALYALDATKGTLLWSVTMQDQLFNAPQVVNNVVYATSTRDDKDVVPPVRSGYAYAFNAKTGTQLWRTSKINEYVVPADPTIVDGVMYMATNNINAGTSSMYAIHTSNGAVIWKQPIDGTIDDAPFVMNGSLYIGIEANSSTNALQVLALKAVDGSTLWSHPLANTSSILMLVSASQAIGPGGLYIGTNGKVLVLDLRNGSQLRTYQITQDQHMPFVYPLFLTLAP